MLLCMSHYLHKLDILGPSVSLTFNSQPQIPTNIGGFLTVIYIGCFAFFVISNFLVYFRKNEPRVVQNSYYNSIPDNISISKTNYPLVISFENDEDSKIGWGRYYYIMDQTNGALLESISLELESCTSSDFHQLPQSEIDKILS